MTELEKEEAKLREIVDELHEVMKESRKVHTSAENAELDKKAKALWEARAKQRRLVYKLRKEASNND